MGKQNANQMINQDRFWIIKQYFSQPVFRKNVRLILNFYRFARCQRIYHLERCLKQPYSVARFYPLLEKCWAQS